jgi:predicted Holliday junction resolvase-like endonuclease
MNGVAEAEAEAEAEADAEEEEEAEEEAGAGEAEASLDEDTEEALAELIDEAVEGGEDVLTGYAGARVGIFLYDSMNELNQRFQFKNEGSF